MSHLVAGDVLEGRYLVDRPIARGGMSTVYRCLDTRLDREVAAKVMDGRYVHDELFLDRFAREARAMAQLSHPNLVGVYDFSADGDVVYLIMELITGGTLRELLAERGPMPPHAATAVLRATLRGLSVAHRRGLVHRDIKPDNILINGDSSVKLADFGLVRAASESRRSSDQIVGTVAYLSPEQVDGSELTQTSDVYSAGIVLFELLTGTVPFSGETSMSHALARLSRDVPAPSSRITGVPKLFDELVATATARDPRDRFADADDFLRALDDVADDLGLPEFTVPVPTQSAAHRVAAIPTGVSFAPEAHEVDAAPPPPHNETYPWQETLAAGAPPQQYTRNQPHQQSVPGQSQVGYSGQSVHSTRPAPPARGPHPVAPERIPTPETNKSPIRLIVALLIIAAATGAIALGGWWFGSGYYGDVPEIIRMY